MTEPLMVEISAGELLDKITILEIKMERMAEQRQLANIAHELNALIEVRDRALTPDPDLERLFGELFGVNEMLWEIEDDIRACEAAGDLGPRFVALARSVYKTNDLRAEIKREINIRTGSRIVEEKSYTDY